MKKSNLRIKPVCVKARNTSKLPYVAVLHTKITGFADEYLEYYAGLRQGKKYICDINGTTIIDKCEGLVRVLLEYKPIKPVQVEIVGSAKGRGNELYAAIIEMYNRI